MFVHIDACYIDAWGGGPHPATPLGQEAPDGQGNWPPKEGVWEVACWPPRAVSAVGGRDVSSAP